MGSPHTERVMTIELRTNRLHRAKPAGTRLKSNARKPTNRRLTLEPGKRQTADIVRIKQGPESEKRKKRHGLDGGGLIEGTLRVPSQIFDDHHVQPNAATARGACLLQSSRAACKSADD
jgi:hypothetical protein